MVSHRYIPNIHQEPINRVMFEPSTNIIMTSSESDTTSVVFMSVTLKQEPYIWKFKQVITVFTVWLLSGLMLNSRLLCVMYS